MGRTPSGFGELVFDSYPKFKRDLFVSLAVGVISTVTFFYCDRILMSGELILKPLTAFFVLLSSFFVGFALFNNTNRYRIFENGIIARASRPKGDIRLPPTGPVLGKRSVFFRDIEAVYPTTTSSGSGDYARDVGVILAVLYEEKKQGCDPLSIYLSGSGDECKQLLEQIKVLKEQMGPSWRRKYMPTDIFFETMEGYEEYDEKFRELTEFFIREAETY